VQKTCDLHFKCKHLAIYAVKIVKISSPHSYNSPVEDPMVKHDFKNKKFALSNISGNFECFLMKKRP